MLEGRNASGENNCSVSSRHTHTLTHSHTTTHTHTLITGSCSHFEYYPLQSVRELATMKRLGLQCFPTLYGFLFSSSMFSFPMMVADWCELRCVDAWNKLRRRVFNHRDREKRALYCWFVSAHPPKAAE